eukprot:8439521-Pyramimonas_sp.AAC.1
MSRIPRNQHKFIIQDMQIDMTLMSYWAKKIAFPPPSPLLALKLCVHLLGPPALATTRRPKMALGGMMRIKYWICRLSRLDVSRSRLGTPTPCSARCTP